MPPVVLQQIKGVYMDFRVLTYFTVVAQELNFTHAAEKLNMSQPPLSSRIKQLEEDLGVQLFIRGKRHLTLTEEGVFFLHRANQILEMADKTRSDLSYMRGGLSGRLNLAIVEGRSPYLAARWLAGFREEFPRVNFEMWNGSSDDVIERLTRGLSDLAVIAKPYDTEHLGGITVGHSPWVAIIPKAHPLAEREGDTVTLKDLKDTPLIFPRRESRIEEIRGWFKEADIEPNISFELSSYIDAVALAEQNAGIAIFPLTTYAPNDLITVKRLTEPDRMIEYVLVWQKGRPQSVLVQEFINFVRDFMEEDMIHSEKYEVKQKQFGLPGET